MAASLTRQTKSSPKQPIQGMQQIKTKITALQQQYEELQKRRHQNIAHLITMLDISELDDRTLLGGLLSIKDKIASQDPCVEVWRQAGERFLRRSKLRKYPLTSHTETPSPKPQSSKKSSYPGDTSNETST